MLVGLILIYIAAEVSGQATPDQELSGYGLINLLYLRSDLNMDGIITQSELDRVFQGFDVNGDGTTTEAEFVTWWQKVTDQPREMAVAYFYLADLNDDNVIDDKDLVPFFQRFDLNGDGQVTSQEFSTKWMDVIDEIPFAVLFIRSDTNKDNNLSQAEFRHYFSTLDSNHDGSLTNSEMQRNWLSQQFGTHAQAAEVYKLWDTDHSGSVTAVDMEMLFPRYDVTHDNQLQILEAIQMAQVIIKIRPGHGVGK